jgi:hypothetical protein
VVAARLWIEPISGRGDGHLGHQERGPVRGREAGIGRDGC